MTYLEMQQNDVQAAKEEARRLRVKMKTFERYLQLHKQTSLLNRLENIMN